VHLHFQVRHVTSLSFISEYNEIAAVKYLENTLKLLETLRESSVFHALVLQSEPGWAKSTTIGEALHKFKTGHVFLGSYSTPLHLYNTLGENPHSFIVIDDCAGLFGDSTAMAILKAATWSSIGEGKARQVAWGSTSEKVQLPEFIFRGKLIILTNTLPVGTETESFLSRALTYRIEFSKEERRELLLQGAKSKKYYRDTALAVRIAKFLIDLIDQQASLCSPISLRTLKMGYELAHTHPKDWQELLQTLLKGGAKARPQEVIQSLVGSPSLVKAQGEQFSETTGMSRRTFFNYRKKLGLSRAYRKS